MTTTTLKKAHSAQHSSRRSLLLCFGAAGGWAPNVSLDGKPLQVVGADTLQGLGHQVGVVAGKNGDVVAGLVPGEDDETKRQARSNALCSI